MRQWSRGFQQLSSATSLCRRDAGQWKGGERTPKSGTTRCFVYRVCNVLQSDLLTDLSRVLVKPVLMLPKALISRMAVAMVFHSLVMASRLNLSVLSGMVSRVVTRALQSSSKFCASATAVEVIRSGTTVDWWMNFSQQKRMRRWSIQHSAPLRFLVMITSWWSCLLVMISRWVISA